MYWKMSVFFTWMFEPDDNIMSEKAAADNNIAQQIYSEKPEPGHKRSLFTFCQKLFNFLIQFRSFKRTNFNAPQFAVFRDIKSLRYSFNPVGL